MNKLIIDTTDNSKTTVELQFKNKSDKITEKSISKSQITLELIDKILTKNGLKPTEIEEIEVNTGPGSFTGTRVGVAIANALGFGLDVKVNGSKSKPASPKYF
jgi:tRNA threonylcarbamoyladenosine biosynthesis protein TsaB